MDAEETIVCTWNSDEKSGHCHSAEATKCHDKRLKKYKFQFFDL